MRFPRHSRRRSGRQTVASRWAARSWPLGLEQLEHRLLLATVPLLLADIAADYESSSPSEFVDVNGVTFLVADDGEHGIELWRTFPTTLGAVLVKDINEGLASGSPASSSPTHLTSVGGMLFFVADDGQHGVELWKSDGTAEGTVLVNDINLEVSETDDSAYGSSPSNLTDVGGTLYFSADDGVHGVELWKSDGTAEGTVLVKDISTAEWDGYVYGSSPSNLTNVNGTLFFTADDFEHGAELWKSDGTGEGTVLVKDINPNQSTYDGYTYGYGSSASNLAAVNGILLFTADDGSRGAELWKSDGTAEGTVLVKDINAQPLGDGSYASSPSNLVAMDGTVYFTADDGEHGQELWKSDGTAEETVLVKDIRPGVGYFYTYEGYDDYGYTYGPYPSLPESLTTVAGPGKTGLLFFTADDGEHGREMWKTDGTSEGTVLVADLDPGEYDADIAQLTDVNGALFFSGRFADELGVGTELWRSDGTEEGTVLAADINVGAEDSYPSLLTNVKGTLYFAANDGVDGVEPWVIVPGALLQGTAFVDADRDGVQDEDELGRENVTVYIDLDGNGQLDASEPRASSGLDGDYALAAEEGVSVIRLQPSPGFAQTTPLDPPTHTVTVIGSESIGHLDFGLELLAPNAVDLTDQTDTGIDVTDNTTRFNNSSSDQALQFRVSGVAQNTFVLIFIDQVQFGTGFASENTVTISTAGKTTLADGPHTVASTQILPASAWESAPSESLTVIVDSTAPTLTNVPSSQVAQVNQPYVYRRKSKRISAMSPSPCPTHLRA